MRRSVLALATLAVALAVAAPAAAQCGPFVVCDRHLYLPAVAAPEAKPQQGYSWQEVTRPRMFSSRLDDIALVSSSEWWASGNLELLHFSAGSISVVTTPVARSISSLVMVSATDGWAVGAEGAILRYTGGSWSAVTSPTSAYLFELSLVSATDGWAVGEAGTILHYTGGAWTP